VDLVIEFILIIGLKDESSMKNIHTYTLITLILSILIAIPIAYTKNPSNLILINAKIYTVNDQQPWAEAVVIKEGNIIFVGNDHDALQYEDSNSQINDLQGKMLLPGFHDIHVHPVHGGVTYLQCN